MIAGAAEDATDLYASKRGIKIQPLSDSDIPRVQFNTDDLSSEAPTLNLENMASSSAQKATANRPPADRRDAPSGQLPEVIDQDIETVIVTAIRQPGDVGYGQDYAFPLGGAGLKQELAPVAALSRLYKGVNLSLGRYDNTHIMPRTNLGPVPSKHKMEEDFSMFRGYATRAMTSYRNGSEPISTSDAVNAFYGSSTGRYFLSLPTGSEASNDFHQYVSTVTRDYFSGDWPFLPPGSATRLEQKLYRDVGY
jgi:hypothetical protein